MDNIGKLRGVFSIWQRLDNGDLLLLAQQSNLINTQGRTAIQKALMNDTPGQDADNICVSSSTAVPAAGDTALPATVVGKAATKSQPSAQVCRWQATFTTGEANQAWRLVGIANATDGTGLIASTQFDTVVTKTSAVELIARYELTIDW